MTNKFLRLLFQSFPVIINRISTHMAAYFIAKNPNYILAKFYFDFFQRPSKIHCHWSNPIFNIVSYAMYLHNYLSHHKFQSIVQITDIKFNILTKFWRFHNCVFHDFHKIHNFEHALPCFVDKNKLFTNCKQPLIKGNIKDNNWFDIVSCNFIVCTAFMVNRIIMTWHPL